MAAWLFGCTAFQFSVSTPYGIQCPTAAVQTVRIAVKDCCGRVVGYRAEAPKPGSKSFVQCRCAEKKNAEHQATMPPKLEPFPPTSVTLKVPDRLQEPLAEHAYASSFALRAVPPTIRPPVLS